MADTATVAHVGTKIVKRLWIPIMGAIGIATNSYFLHLCHLLANSNTDCDNVKLVAGSSEIPRGESVKLAIIVSVPDLTRFGYGRIAAECIGSMARIADRVYLVESSRRMTTEIWRGNESVVGMIGNDATWFSRMPEGEEWFDPYKVAENTNLGMSLARDAGYDVAACLMCNQYIPEAQGEGFYHQAWLMLENNIAWSWVYRMDQLGDQLFHSSVRVPFLVNLRGPALRWSTDSIHDGAMLTTMQRGNYAEMDALSVVDVQLEVTREELAAKQNYIRCYSDILPKRKPVFEWGYWFPYYVNKFQKKSPAGTVTDPVGVAIAAKSEPDFVSQQVLGAL